MTTKLNYGFITPIIKNEDYVLGGGQAPLIQLQKDGQWDEWIDGLDERQSNIFFDSAGCTGYGLENQKYSYMKRRYGIEDDSSERAIGIVAKTRPPGNDPNIVYQKNRETGFIKQSSLPFDDNIRTVEQFYSPDPLTPELLQEAKEWNEKYELFHEWVWRPGSAMTLEEKIHNMKVALKYAPLAFEVYAWATDDRGVYVKLGQANHWVCCYGYTDLGWKIYDSYDKSHKIYSFENDINFCKRISIELRKEIPSNSTTDIGSVLLLWITRFFNKIKNIFK